MVQELSVIAMLGICGLEDVRNKQIRIWWPLLFAIEGIICWIFWQRQPITGILLATVPGILIMALAFLGRQSIGQGDGMLLMVMGIFLGAARTIWVFLYALFFSAAYALYLYTIKRKSKNYEIPFVPFMLIAFVAELILRE